MLDTPVPIRRTTEDGKKRLGEYLRQARKSKVGSMDKLIELVEKVTGKPMGKSTVSHIERGNVLPEFETLQAICAVGHLDKSPQELLEMTREDVPQPPKEDVYATISRLLPYLSKEMKWQLGSKLVKEVLEEGVV